jgi:hypothetical protein
VTIEAALGQYSFGRLVFALDERLRRLHSVIDYVDHPDCILRIQISEARKDIALTSGVRVHSGDRLIDLHLWNEHLPEMGHGGPSVAWARRVSKLLDFSLGRLSNYMASRRQFDDIAVIRAVMPLRGLEQSRHVQFIAARYGFEAVNDSPPRSLGARLHRAGENALGLMLAYATNPAAARLDILLRARAPLFLSRRHLDDRYQTGRAPRAPDPVR